MISVAMIQTALGPDLLGAESLGFIQHQVLFLIIADNL